MSPAGGLGVAFPPPLRGWQWRFHGETEIFGMLCAAFLVLNLHLKQGKKLKKTYIFLSINGRWILIPRCRRNSPEICRRVTGY